MKQRWTKEGENVLIEQVAQAIRGGRRVSDGLLEAAEKLGRTPSACEFRYYSQLHNSEDKRMKVVEEAKRERLMSRLAAYRKGG